MTSKKNEKVVVAVPVGTDLVKYTVRNIKLDFEGERTLRGEVLDGEGASIGVFEVGGFFRVGLTRQQVVGAVVANGKRLLNQWLAERAYAVAEEQLRLRLEGDVPESVQVDEVVLEESEMVPEVVSEVLPNRNLPGVPGGLPVGGRDDVSEVRDGSDA